MRPSAWYTITFKLVTKLEVHGCATCGHEPIKPVYAAFCVADIPIYFRHYVGVMYVTGVTQVCPDSLTCLLRPHAGCCGWAVARGHFSAMKCCSSTYELTREGPRGWKGIRLSEPSFVVLWRCQPCHITPQGRSLNPCPSKPCGNCFPAKPKENQRRCDEQLPESAVHLSPVLGACA